MRKSLFFCFNLVPDEFAKQVADMAFSLRCHGVSKVHVGSNHLLICYKTKVFRGCFALLSAMCYKCLQQLPQSATEGLSTSPALGISVHWRSDFWNTRKEPAVWELPERAGAPSFNTDGTNFSITIRSDTNGTNYFITIRSKTDTTNTDGANRYNTDSETEQIAPPTRTTLTAPT